jgi:peptidoglycan/xylan/chitin deacetylase (PgdA/CDA1 family)
VVTFDDGYQNVFTQAWPVLRDLRVPATIFVNTAFLDSAAPFPFDKWGLTHRHDAPPDAYLPLTAAQCREMHASGLIDLGAHTHTHQDFRGRPDAFQRDLQTCVELIRESFGIRDATFAFPFGRRRSGYVSDELVAAARQTGVTCGLTTEAELVDPTSDPFSWGRFNVYEFDTGATLAAKLQGWYGWAPRWEERLSRVIRPRAGWLRVPRRVPVA